MDTSDSEQLPEMETPPAADHLDEVDPDAVVPGLLSFFGQKHTLAILYEFAFAEKPLRFNELESTLDVSSTTLSNRLGDLVDGEFVTRQSYDEIPPRVEYRATEKTRSLAPIIADLYDWAKTYEHTPSLSKHD